MGAGPRPRARGLLAAAVTLALVGCVSTAERPSPTDPHRTTTTVPPTTTTTVTVAAAVESYRACLGERSVEVGEIGIDGRGRPRLAPLLGELDFSDRIVIEALDSCADQLATGALVLDSDPELAALIATTLTEFSECMRRNGVSDYPDPLEGFDGIGSPYAASAIPWEDEELDSAANVCKSLLTRSSS